MKEKAFLQWSGSVRETAFLDKEVGCENNLSIEKKKKIEIIYIEVRKV